MPTSVSLVVDSREFDRALALYVTQSKRDLAYILNKAGANIAYGAIPVTRKADTAKIEAELRHVAAVRIAGKRGQRLRMDVTARTMQGRHIYRANRVAHNILMARMHKAGRNLKTDFPSREAIDAEVNKMVAARKSSVAFIRSGWLAAARGLGRLVRLAKRVDGDTGKFKHPMGGFTVAQPGNSPVCSLWNTSVNPKNKTSAAALMRYGQPGLETAVNNQAREMVRWATERLAATARRYSARRR